MENRKRNVHLHVMVTPDELAAIHERMAEAGISNAGAYVRKMALNGYILHIDLTPVKELISLQRRCSNNLNQVAIHAHTYGVYPEEIDGLKRDYEKLWGEVSKVLRELSEVATLAVVTNGFQKVQIRRLAESGVLNFMEDVFVSEKMDSEKPNRRIFDAALRALGVENREHVLVVGDGLSSDIQGGVNAGLDTCWFNPGHAENPGKVTPTYEIASLEELYPLVMEPEELANLGLKHRRHQP